jgi:hypothetical protein
LLGGESLRVFAGETKRERRPSFRFVATSLLVPKRERDVTSLARVCESGEV